MFSCIVYHYSKLLHKKLSHAQRILKLLLRDVSIFPERSILTDWLIDWLINRSIDCRFGESCREWRRSGAKGKTKIKNKTHKSCTCCTACQTKFVVRSDTAFPSTFVPSTLFPQVRLKQYAGLHVDTLVVPVIRIRVLFAIKPSPFSLLISRWHGIWTFSYKNENCLVFYPQLTSKLRDRRFTKFGPMIHFTCQTTRIIYIHTALYPFPCMVNFSFWGDYQC